MNPRVPRLTAEELKRALERGGWRGTSQVGSHLSLRHPDRQGKIIVPMHPGTLPTGTLTAIVKQAALSGEELRRLL